MSTETTLDFGFNCSFQFLHLCSVSVLLVEAVFCIKADVLNCMSLLRKPAFCICENKDPDQLCSDCEADQRLCFRYTDSTIPLLPKSEISSL